MSHSKILTILAVLSANQACFSQQSNDAFAVGDSLTVRLQPSAFPKLPKNIVAFLERGGYTIPQCYFDTKPHNVISGSFGKEGQLDWVVLASRNRSSRIFIFWAGSDTSLAEVELMTDRTCLQGTSAGKTGFSREIGVANRHLLQQLHERYGGTKPPSIEHDGIYDRFDEKGSSMHYFYEGKWLSLTGDD